MMFWKFCLLQSRRGTKSLYLSERSGYVLLAAVWYYLSLLSCSIFCFVLWDELKGSQIGLFN
jgi:hypothetical protein